MLIPGRGQPNIDRPLASSEGHDFSVVQGKHENNGTAAFLHWVKNGLARDGANSAESTHSLPVLL